ncbi:MAG: pyridoxamine 5'-phosphate oxidase family protein [Polyangiales bacterium]
MNTIGLLKFLRRQPWAIQASTAADGGPQAAVVGFAVTDRFEIVFDTLGSTRKAGNLRRNPQIALVIGWDEGQTAQIEGLADEPQGDDLARCQAFYFARFPEGTTRLSWPHLTYFRVRPTWIRLSDFRGGEPSVTVFDEAMLRE